MRGGLDIIVLMLLMRDIATKWDFCSFHGMKYLFAFFFGFTCSISVALAGYCDDFPDVMKSNLAELERLKLRYESVSLDKAEQCRFGRDEVFPVVEKTINQINLYESCKTHGYTARSFVTSAQAMFEDLETEFKRDCK